MRVCVDVVPLLVRSAGVKNYLYHWVTHLLRLAGPETIRLFPALALGPLDHERSVAGPVRSAWGLASAALVNYGRVPVHRWTCGRSDVFHSSNLIRVPPSGLRLTTTLHDLTSWVLPQTHSAANRRADRGYEAMLRRADRIIAVSESTRNDAVRILGLDPDKIDVIHSGVAAAFFRVSASDAHRVRKALGLGRPYVLFVGTVEPRKNLGTLLDAWATAAPTLRQEFDLVLAGPPGWGAQDVQARLASPPPGVRYLGYVPESQLAGLTAGAALFVYPSLYEGFGFPVVQAMAAGVPVVTSNVSSLPELVGECGDLVDPRSVSELAAAMARLLLSPDLRRRRAEAGRLRAAQFTWERCASRSLEFLRTAVAG